MYRCLQSHSMQLHCMDHLYFCMKYWEFCVSLLTPEIFNILFWNRIKRPIWLINCMCPVLLFDCLTVQIFCRQQLRRDTNMKWQRCRDTITETVTSVFGECCCLSALTGQICIKLLSVPSFLVSYLSSLSDGASLTSCQISKDEGWKISLLSWQRGQSRDDWWFEYLRIQTLKMSAAFTIYTYWKIFTIIIVWTI